MFTKDNFMRFQAFIMAYIRTWHCMVNFNHLTLHYNPTAPNFNRLTLHYNPTAPNFNHLTQHYNPTAPNFNHLHCTITQQHQILTT
jgi:hypothetical protein